MPQSVANGFKDSDVETLLELTNVECFVILWDCGKAKKSLMDYKAYCNF